MIHLEDINRVFTVGDQEVHALRNISLRIEAGDYLSIMGPSGSGKSTLLNILGVLDRPSSGSYLFAGNEITVLDEEQQACFRREKIGFVFQFFHLVPRLTAQQNIELPLMLAGRDPAFRHARSSALMQELGILDRARHRPQELSGGQRQRVAIARAMITEPALLLADEPTGNLDRQSGAEVVKILEDLNGRGVTLLVVTHDPEIGSRANRRIRMVDGRVVGENEVQHAAE